LRPNKNRLQIEALKSYNLLQQNENLFDSFGNPMDKITVFESKKDCLKSYLHDRPEVVIIGVFSLFAADS